MSAKTTSNIITIVIVLLALAAAIFAILKIGEDMSQQDKSQMILTEEEHNQIKEQAAKLLAENNLIFKLYNSDMLPVLKEPYGNKPEDGLLTVDLDYNKLSKIIYDVTAETPPTTKDGYAQYEQIEELVKRTYVEQEAQRILTNYDGTNTPIYTTRKDRLGRKYDFKPIVEIRDWTNIRLVYDPISKTECDLTIYFNGITQEQIEASDYTDSDYVKVKMRMYNQKWYLEKLVN